MLKSSSIISYTMSRKPFFSYTTDSSATTSRKKQNPPEN